MRKVIGIMMIVMMMGCNSGNVAEESSQSKFLKSVVSVSNEFLNIFTSFGEMIGGVLGFNVETKKSDVGLYFKKVKETVEGTKDKLEKIVADMKNEGNPNTDGVETVVKKLVSEKLDKIINGAKAVNEVIGSSDDLIGTIVDQSVAGAYW